MGRLLDRFIGVMGFGEDYDEDEFDNERLEEEEKRGKNRKRKKTERESEFAVVESFESKEPALPANPFREGGGKKQASVVSVYSQKQVKVIVMEPVSFEESQTIADHLKARRSVIVNLEKTDVELSQRIVDFISGTTYAIGGNMQKVGNGIFMFVPPNVDISGEVSFRSSEKSSLLWQMGQ